MKRALTIVFRLCLLTYVAVLFTSCSCKKYKIPTNDKLRFALSTTKDSYSIIGIGGNSN